MESITKNRQSPESLRRLIAHAYGQDQVPEGDGWAVEFGHGWFNVAYLITLRDGSRAVLKIAPPPGVEVMTYERDIMRIEVAALELIRSQTSVPVPEVHCYDASRALCDAEYFFMAYVDADNLGEVRDGLAPAEVARYDEARGAVTREINQLHGEHFGSLLGPAEQTWRQSFERMMAEVLDDGERRSVDLGVDYATVRRLYADHADCLDQVADPVLVEWDLWDGNMMIRDGQVVGIIDHERVFWGDPLIEAGFVSTELPTFGDPADFLRGYGRGPLTEGERARRRLYNLHLLLIMVIETVYRGHTEPTQYNWARARLAEALAMFGVQTPARHE